MTSQPGTAVPTSSKLLCGAYAAVAIAALVATWSQNVAYFGGSADFMSGFGQFWQDTKVNPASRSITVDIVFFSLAATILMVIEARKHGVKFVWAYVVGGLLVAISVTFPLFLIARELRIARTDPALLRAADTVPLALFAAACVGFVIWVDVL